MPWSRGWRHRGLPGPFSGMTSVAPGGTSGSNQRRRVALRTRPLARTMYERRTSAFLTYPPTIPTIDRV